MTNNIYTTVQNPRWGNEEHTVVYCEVFFIAHNEILPFAATSYDPMEYGVQIFAECVAGNYGPIAEYVEPPVPEYVAPPEPTKSELLAQIQALTAQVQALGE